MLKHEQKKGQRPLGWTSKEIALFKSFLLRGFSMVDIKEEFLSFSYCQDRSIKALEEKKRIFQQETNFENTTPWTPLQDVLLKELHQIFPEDDLSLILGKSKAQIQQRRLALDTKEAILFQKKYYWTKEEETTLIVLYRICSEQTLEKIFKRSYNSLHQKANKLGITNPRTWTKREKRILREIYPNTPMKEIMERLNRSEQSIESYASILGLRKKGIYWTPEENNVIKKLRETSTCKEIAAALQGRTGEAVQTQALKLGIQKGVGEWSYKDDQLLKKLYKKKSDHQLAESFGRSLMAIRKRRYHLGLERPSQKWSSKEIAILTRNFHKKTALALTELLNRSVNAINNKAKNIGLRKLKQYTPLEDDICMNSPRKFASNLLNRTLKSVIARKWKVRQKEKPLSEDEIHLLRELYNKKGVMALARLLRRTPAVLRNKIRELGLSKKSDPWEPCEERLLEILLKGWSPKKIANFLGRSMSSVKNRIYRLELDLPKEDQEKEQQVALACNFILRTLTGIGPELHYQFGTKRYALLSFQIGDRSKGDYRPRPRQEPSALALAFARARACANEEKRKQAA